MFIPFTSLYVLHIIYIYIYIYPGYSHATEFICRAGWKRRKPKVTLKVPKSGELKQATGLVVKTLARKARDLRFDSRW